MDTEKKELVRVVGFKGAREFVSSINDTFDGKREQSEAEEALKKDENDVEAHYKLADALRKLAKIEDALKHYEKVIELDKENQKGLKVKALFRLGEGLLVKARRNEFVEALKKAEEKFKEVEKLDAEKKGGFADRIEFYRLVAKVSKTITMDRRGKVSLLAGKKPEDAKQCGEELSSFAQKYPDSEYAPSALYQSLLLYEAVEDYAKAVEQLDKLLKDYSDTQVAFAAKQRKEELMEKVKEKKEEPKEEGK